MPFNCQCHPVSLWRWPLTCNLEKCYSLRSSFGMYNLEPRLRYLHLSTRHCPCNLLPEPTSPKLNIEGNFEATLWRHRGCHHQGKFLGIIWDVFFISEVKLKLCLIFQNFQNGRHFVLATNFFFYRKWYRKLNIPEIWPLAFPTFNPLDQRFSSNIDVYIKISKLTHFVTWWLHQWCHEDTFI